MKLENKGQGFEVTFDGETHDVPAGKFEVTIDALGHYIVYASKRWGLQVEITEDSKKSSEGVAKIVNVDTEKVEKPKEVAVPKTDKKEKSVTGATTSSLPRK